MFKSIALTSLLLQSLIPSSSPNFTITKVSISNSGTFAAVSGRQGVLLIELPLRWGTDGIYQDAKPKIICQSFVLHENNLNNFEILQTRWHPQSPTDSHLLVLLSNNSIMMFEESTLKHTWRIGPLPSAVAVARNLSFLEPLGDTAIDFDIAPPKLRDDLLNENNDNIENLNNTLNNLSLAPKQQTKQIEWPIIILRGNGKIFILNAGFNTEKPRLQGPLKMMPSKKDNYGDDSCSLLVIPTLPPTLVIAENRGMLHHIVMIETKDDETSLNDSKSILSFDYDLFVLESIELELGLKEDDQKESSASPVLLKRDPVNEQRYFCYHETGLHGINIGFLPQIQSYIENDESDEVRLNIKSKAEYILSTKATSSSKVNAVLGFGVLQSPSGIFTILSSGQVVSLNTMKIVGNQIPDINSSPPKIKSKEIDRRIPFDQHIRAILSGGVSQPLLNLDKSKPPTPQQAFEILMNSMQVMRDQYKRHDQVRFEISKKCKILEVMKNQQNDDISQLLDDKHLIQEKAYKLAEMHEDIMERQQSLQKRVQDILRLSLLRLPNAGAAEQEFTDQIKKIKTKVDKISQDVKQVKSKYEIQKVSVENMEITTQKPIIIPQKQEEAIKEILTEMTKQISTLTKDVQQLCSVVEIQ